MGLNGLIATTLTAMGSHYLSFKGEDELLFQQASEFHFHHTLALIVPALLAKWGQNFGATLTTSFFMLGMLGFSGSLYYRAVEGAGSLGGYHWVTPIGGLLLMLGWLTLTISALRITPKR